MRKDLKDADEMVGDDILDGKFHPCESIVLQLAEYFST